MKNTEIASVMADLGLSDGKMAIAVGVTRQTVRNWRRGAAYPPIAQNAIKWMMELRRIDPDNDNLPKNVRVKL